MWRWMTRCTLLVKPGLGTVHLHARWWRPGRVSEMQFEPAGTGTCLVVPERAWDEVLAATSAEVAVVLAAIRRPRDPEGR